MRQMEFNNYQDTINYLFAQLPMYQRTGKAAYKANLDNTLELDRTLDYPHRKFLSIHVGGTNGKGSVAHLLASVFMEAGFKTGLYTSPHLIDFRERIKINGGTIEKEAVVKFVRENHKHFERISPSFFEMTVAMAFDYFAREKVDIAIIEVGLGGRLDSTNIISPICSVITNIGSDHADLLGSTHELIAYEKAGIIKNRKPVIIGETQENVKHVFLQKAELENSKIVFADNSFTIDYSMISMDNFHVFNINKNETVYLEQIKTKLFGKYQLKNALTLIQTIEIVREQFKISNDAIYKGFEKVVENTGIRGRWEISNYKPLTICDTGHNVEGIKEIVEQIEMTAFRQLHFVFGVVNDKNIDSILELLPKHARYYFTKASIPRALDSGILAEKARKQRLIGDVFSDVESAYLSAYKNAAAEDLIFIGGSTFVVADFLAHEIN